MKKIIYNLLTPLLLTLIVYTVNASNSTKPGSNNRNLKFPILIVQQQPKDTASYWVIANDYYIAFTKDTIPNQWVYKYNTLATNVKNPDPAKKIAGATVTTVGGSVRITIGSKMYLFRTLQSANMLRFMTVINTGTSYPDKSPANK